MVACSDLVGLAYPVQTRGSLFQSLHDIYTKEPGLPLVLVAVPAVVVVMAVVGLVVLVAVVVVGLVLVVVVVLGLVTNRIE